jgi:hypothetical protein
VKSRQQQEMPKKQGFWGRQSLDLRICLEKDRAVVLTRSSAGDGS